MFCRNYRQLGITSEGNYLIDAEIVSSKTPDTMPTDGTGILNIAYPAEKVRFAPGSVLFAVEDNAVFVANEDGVFCTPGEEPVPPTPPTPGVVFDATFFNEVNLTDMLVGADGGYGSTTASDEIIGQKAKEVVEIMKSKALEYDIATEDSQNPGLYSATFDLTHPCGISSVSFGEFTYIFDSGMQEPFPSQTCSVTYNASPIYEQHFVDDIYDSARLMPRVAWGKRYVSGEISYEVNVYSVILPFEVSRRSGGPHSAIAGVHFILEETDDGNIDYCDCGLYLPIVQETLVNEVNFDLISSVYFDSNVNGVAIYVAEGGTQGCYDYFMNIYNTLKDGKGSGGLVPGVVFNGYCPINKLKVNTNIPVEGETGIDAQEVDCVTVSINDDGERLVVDTANPFLQQPSPIPLSSIPVGTLLGFQAYLPTDGSLGNMGIGFFIREDEGGNQL